MNGDNNPYGGGSSGYTTQVNFGDQDAPKPEVERPSEILLGGENGSETDLIKDTTTTDFAADVIQESRNQPVIVDFWAPWCGPCKQLQPALEKVVREAGGAVKLVKMNIDEHPAVAGQLGVQSIPAVFAFKDGRPVDGFMGAVPESQIREFIARLGGEAPDRIAEALEAAREALDSKDFQMAGQIASAILQQEPENVTALGVLAEALYDLGEKEQARKTLENVPETKKDDPAVARIRARIALDERVSELGDPEELSRRLRSDPNDHQARFDLAIIENALGNRQAAADCLLEIVRRDRGWNDDGARAQLLQFFEAWGPTDDVTQSSRRKLSSMLFS